MSTLVIHLLPTARPSIVRGEPKFLPSHDIPSSVMLDQVLDLHLRNVITFGPVEQIRLVPSQLEFYTTSIKLTIFVIDQQFDY